MYENEMNNMPLLTPQTTTTIYDNINEIRFKNRKSIKILYLNARSIKNKLDDLTYHIY